MRQSSSGTRSELLPGCYEKHNCTAESGGWKSGAIGSSYYAGVAFADFEVGLDSIEILEVQLEGRKRMATAAFLNGFSFDSDEALA